jgi:hypothetical protein
MQRKGAKGRESGGICREGEGRAKGREGAADG